MWYEYHQTPVDGTYIYNDKICGHVLIESHSCEEANRLAELLGIIFGEDCGYEPAICRWERCYYELEFPSVWDNNLRFDNVEDYSNFIYHRRHRVGANHTTPHSRIYHKNGTIKEVGHK
jgi:hypothetical protein